MVDPKLCSLKSEIMDMEKQPVNKLLSDDWNSNNTFGSSVKVNSTSPGNWLKYNSKMAVTTPDGAASFKLSDNVQIGMKFHGKYMKAQIKNGQWYEHYALCNKSFSAPWNKENNIDVHSYFRWGASTALRNWHVSKGWCIKWCENARSRLQVNWAPNTASEDTSAWSANGRHFVTWNNLWVNLAYSWNFKNILSQNLRDFRAGYDLKDIGLSFYLRGERDNEDKDAPFFDSLTVGASYSKCKWILGAWWQKFLDGRPSLVEAAVSKQLCSRSSVKGKVDNEGNFNILGKANTCGGVDLELSVGTNVLDPGSVGGIYDLPFNVGLKCKINK